MASPQDIVNLARGNDPLQGVKDFFGGIVDWWNTTGSKNLARSHGLDIAGQVEFINMSPEQRTNRMINQGISAATMVGGILTGGLGGAVMVGSGLITSLNPDEPALLPAEAERRQREAVDQAKAELKEEGQLRNAQTANPEPTYIFLGNSGQSSGENLQNSFSKMVPLMMMMMLLPQLMSSIGSKQKDSVEIDKDAWS